MSRSPRTAQHRGVSTSGSGNDGSAGLALFWIGCALVVTIVLAPLGILCIIIGLLMEIADV